MAPAVPVDTRDIMADSVSPLKPPPIQESTGPVSGRPKAGEAGGDARGASRAGVFGRMLDSILDAKANPAAEPAVAERLPPPKPVRVRAANGAMIAPPVPRPKPDVPDQPPSAAAVSPPTTSTAAGTRRASMAGPLSHAAMAEAVQTAARAAGVNPAELMAKAARESNFDPRARSRTSSAAGPFQFIERTWLDLVRRHGAAYGLANEAAAIEVGRNGAPFVRDPALRRQLLDLRHDVHVSAGMAARYLDEVGHTMERILHRNPTDTERRLAYVLGPGGASRLIAAAARDPQGSSAALLPEAAAANRALFYADGQALTNQAALTRLNRLVDRDLVRFQNHFREDERVITDLPASRPLT